MCPLRSSGQQLSWEQFAEDFLSEGVDEGNVIDRQEAMEFLQQLHEHPVNLNDCSRDDLLKIPYLTSEEVDSILSYVRRYGPVRSLQELQFVTVLDAFHRSVMSFFTTAGPARAPAGAETLWHQLEKGRQEAALNFGVPFYRRQGYRTTFNKKGEPQPKKYAGDPYYVALRYRYELSNKLDAALTAEKDDGEAFGSHGNYPFDSYSFCVRYRGKGFLNTFLAGDYRIQSGLGLVSGSSFMSNALSLVSSSRAIQSNIYRHASTDEYRFFRGAATRLNLGRTMLTLFGSYRRLDAVTKDSGVTSFLRTGYHRLALERSRKENLGAAAAGASLDVRWHFWHVGATVLYLHYSKPFMRGSRPYQRYNMEGHDFINLSVHYGLERKVVNFGGEAAFNGAGGLALLHELRWRPRFGVRLFLQHRYYDPRYHAPMAMSYAAAGHLSNEHGVLAGLNLTLMRRFRLLAYADVFRLPSASYYADKGSDGYSFNVMTNYEIRKFGTLQLRYVVKARQESVDSLSLLRYRYRHTLRLQASCGVGALAMVTMAEGSYWQPALGKAQWGRALLQRVSVRLNHWSLAAWGAWFHTGGYRSALSAYQPSLLYSTSFVSLFGHGYAGAVVAEYQCGRHWIFSGKWALIRYTHQKSIGLADREIRKPVKADLMLQLRYLF